MAEDASTPANRPLFRGPPSGIVPYVAIVAALASAYVHLSLAPTVLQFDRLQAILFVLAGVGFLAGIAVYLSRYWRRELYLVAIVFALAQIAAFFVLGGRLSDMAIVSKVSEGVFAVAAAYLYASTDAF